MARARSLWIIVAILAIAAFAVGIGGFLWPRPQFEEGRAPWTLEEREPPSESLPPVPTTGSSKR